MSERFDMAVREASGTGDLSGGFRVLFDAAPPAGEAMLVAPGIWWIRLPLQSHLDHVNVYALEDEGGWTLVDTGSATEGCKAALQALFTTGQLSDRPIKRFIATHYHPDHVGLAGWLSSCGAEFLTTRLCYLYARMLQLDNPSLPYPEQVRFAERAGLKGLTLAAYRRRPPSSYPTLVMPIPFSYTRISDGDKIVIGERAWSVRIGHGHAAGHATLWSNDGIALLGDQVLPGISSNLSVHPSEPDADLVSEWIASCEDLIAMGDDNVLCLPGHNIPFVGVVSRCRQLLATQEAVLQRLLEHLERPSAAIDCLYAVYRRELEPHELSTLLAETVGFLNHLRKKNLIGRELLSNNTYVWRRVRTSVDPSVGPERRVDPAHLSMSMDQMR